MLARNLQNLDVWYDYLHDGCNGIDCLSYLPNIHILKTITHVKLSELFIFKSSG